MSQAYAPSQQNLSIIVPVYNEEEVLDQLIDKLLQLRCSLPDWSMKFILVNDGSTDNTGRIIKTLALKHEDIIAVQLSRNFGQQAALAAGLRLCDSDAAILMDADLQDNPNAVLQFLEKFQEGYDVVYAIRKDRKEHFLLRTAYTLFYRSISSISETPLPRDSGDFCLMSRRVVNALNSLPECTRYLRGMRAWVGFRQIGIEVERKARAAGESKYSLTKLIRLGLDGIFSFSLWPLRLITFIGILTMSCSFTYFIYSLVQKYATDTVPDGFTALVGLVVFLAGLQIMTLGILGEYIGRIFQEVKQRPTFIIQQVDESTASKVHQDSKSEKIRNNADSVLLDKSCATASNRFLE